MWSLDCVPSRPPRQRLRGLRPLLQQEQDRRAKVKKQFETHTVVTLASSMAQTPRIAMIIIDQFLLVMLT